MDESQSDEADLGASGVEASSDQETSDVRSHRWAKQVVRVVAWILLALAAYGTVMAVSAAATGRATEAWEAAVMALVVGLMGLFLFNRPVPTRPALAVVGALLVGSGLIRAAMESYRPWAGLAVVGAGVWATLSARQPIAVAGEVATPRPDPEPTRVVDGRSAQHVVRLVAATMLLLALAALVLGVFEDSAEGWRNVRVVAFAEVVLSIFLLTRRTPGRPRRAVLGATLVAVGGTLTAVGEVNLLTGWPEWRDFSGGFYGRFVGIGSHMAEIGFVVLAVGLWATVSATIRHRGYVPVVLYEGGEEPREGTDGQTAI